MDVGERDGLRRAPRLTGTEPWSQFGTSISIHSFLGWLFLPFLFLAFFFFFFLKPLHFPPI